MKHIAILIGLFVCSMSTPVFGEPTSAPTSQPAISETEVELSRHKVGDEEFVLFRHIKIVPNPRIDRRDREPTVMLLGYQLRRPDDPATIYWRTPGDPTEGMGWANQDPQILALELKKDVMTVVYRQTRLTWGDITRVHPGDTPERLVTGICAVVPGGGDFSPDIVSADIEGNYDRNTLVVATKAKDGKTERFRPTPRDSKTRWEKTE